jgi:hypothetical protein
VSAAAETARGTQFTCFTGTKVQILTKTHTHTHTSFLCRRCRRGDREWKKETRNWGEWGGVSRSGGGGQGARWPR